MGAGGAEVQIKDLELGGWFPAPAPPLRALAGYANSLSLVLLICEWGQQWAPHRTIVWLDELIQLKHLEEQLVCGQCYVLSY